MLTSASNSYLAAATGSTCDQVRLVEAIRDLLGFYYQPDESPEHRARQIALFVKDLADQSDDAAFWAVDEWRRTQDRRPTPAALRQLAMMRREAAFKATAARRPPPDPTPVYVEPDPERRAAFLAEIDATLSHLASKVDAETAAQRRPHWTETAPPDDPRWDELRRAREANALMNPQTKETV